MTTLILLREGLMKPIEDKLKAHAQRKIEHENRFGPMNGQELFSHEQYRKKLLKDLSRARSKANNRW